MPDYEPSSLHSRKVLIFCFNIDNYAAGAHTISEGLIVETLSVIQRLMSSLIAGTPVILESKTCIAWGGREVSKTEKWMYRFINAQGGVKKVARSLTLSHRELFQAIESHKHNSETKI